MLLGAEGYENQAEVTQRQTSDNDYEEIPSSPKYIHIPSTLHFVYINLYSDVYWITSSVKGGRTLLRLFLAACRG